MLNKIIYTILGFSMAFVFFPRGAHDAGPNANISGASTRAIENIIAAAPEMAVTIPPPSMTSKAAVAYDYHSGTILYSNNLTKRLPIASLTKLMTALVVLKHANLDDHVTIQKFETTAVGATMGLRIGEKITVGDLLSGMLVASSNDAALALSNHVAGNLDEFTKLMNKEALNLQLADTRFANPVGWDSDENYSTIWDLMKIVKEVLDNQKLSEIVAIRETNLSSVDGKFAHSLHTTNQLMLLDPNISGIKTGFTSKALGSLIILYNRDSSRIITIVLDSENREEDTQKLLDWVFGVYKW